MKALSRTAELEKVLNFVSDKRESVPSGVSFAYLWGCTKNAVTERNIPLKGDGASWKPKQIVEWWRRCIQIVTGSFAVMEQCRLE